MHGERDETIAASHGRGLHARLVGSAVNDDFAAPLWVPTAGHDDVVDLDRSSAFVARVRGFVDAVARRANRKSDGGGGGGGKGKGTEEQMTAVAPSRQRMAKPTPPAPRRDGGAFYTLVPIRPRWRGGRRSLRTFAGVSLRPPPAFNPHPRRLSTPPDAFELHPDFRLYGTARRRAGEGRPRAARRERVDAIERARKEPLLRSTAIASTSHRTTYDARDDTYSTYERTTR